MFQSQFSLGKPIHLKLSGGTILMIILEMEEDQDTSILKKMITISILLHNSFPECVCTTMYMVGKISNS